MSPRMTLVVCIVFATTLALVMFPEGRDILARVATVLTGEGR